MNPGPDPGAAAASGGPARRSCLIVLGMHRSGTSALTRMLSLLGAALPKNLMRPQPGVNDTGFWEPVRIVALHDEILQELDSRWDDVLPINPSWFASAPARDCRDRLAAMTREEFGDAPLFVLKDPRVCRLLPLWGAVLKQLDVEPLYLHIVRNPLEVARSLQARDAFPQSKSLLLWLGHLLAAEHATRGRRRACVRYADLLADPLGTAERLGRDLALVWPRDSYLAQAEIEQFLSRRHRHHTIPDEEISASGGITAWIKEAWELLAPTTGEERRASGFEALRQRYLEASENYGQLVALLERELREERERRQDLDAQAAVLQAEKANLEAEGAALRDDQRNLAAQIAALQGEKAAMAAEAHRTAAQRDAELAGLRNELAGLRNAHAGLRTALARSSWVADRRSLRFWLRTLRSVPLIRRSGLFDAGYYRTTYPDTRSLLVPPLLHFLSHGWREDRNPHPRFDTAWYKLTYPDVAAAGVNPLVHFLLSGRREGRQTHPAAPSLP